MLTFFDLCVVVALASIVSLLIGENSAHENDGITTARSQVTFADHLKADDLNTTVVILNWSRLPNVNKIISGICKHLLGDTVHGIIIWNNNPKALSFEDFPNTPCPKSRLRINNSPENLYFQARYLACAEATTPYCFIQDDDFLIRPEIIKTLSLRINEGSLSAIHIQPPDEMLSSQMRATIVGSKIHTTFAWLGYGTIIRRSQAVNFYSLLEKLGLSDNERKMADNYFTILGNTIPERWFDAGIDLGGGQPFTVGTEGDERNNRHILKAAELLDSIASSSRDDLPYTSFTRGNTSETINISRAPCHDRICVFGTSVKLLPEGLFKAESSAASEILELEEKRLLAFGQARKFHYLSFPPSHAVDGRLDTAFRSPENAKKDDWISLDLMRPIVHEKNAELVLLVDSATQLILQNATFEASRDGIAWIAWDHHIRCTCTDTGTADVRLCRTSLNNGCGRFFRVRSIGPVEEKWAIYEMYVDIL